MLAELGQRLACVVVALGVYAACAATPALATPDWDPSAAIAAYSAALNAHDLPAALALFDDTGSATDIRGRHFEGHAGLTEFLLANGFGQAEARLETERVHIVANRAVWTYSCSCAPGSTEVRMVTNHNKITVFAVVAPPSGPIRRVEPAGLPWRTWLPGLGVLGLGLLGCSVRLGRRRRSDAAPRRGGLLSALALARSGARR
jgi:SnoaL-like domain